MTDKQTDKQREQTAPRQADPIPEREGTKLRSQVQLYLFQCN